MRSVQSTLFVLLLASCYIHPAYAAVSNRTIDDSFGDSATGQQVSYLPTTQGVWKTQNCGDCALFPDTAQAFRGTYTAATYHPELDSISATLTFQGTAIYVYFILAYNAPPGITTATAVNFTLDDQPPVTRLPPADGPTVNFQYNVMLWSQTGLPPTQHTLVVSTSGLDDSFYVDFDYAVYTHDDEFLVSVASPTSTPALALATTPATTSMPALMTTATFLIPSATASSVAQISSQSATTSTHPEPITTLANGTQSTTTSASATAIFMSSSTTTSPSPTSLDSEGGNTSSRTSQLGEIAGGAVGGAVIVLAILFAVLCLRRHRRQRTSRLRFKSKRLTSNIQDSTEALRSPSPIPSSASDEISSEPPDTATPAQYGEAFVAEKSHRASRFTEQQSPTLSYTSGQDSPVASSSPRSDDVSQARQAELAHRLTERQEAMRELASDLDGSSNTTDSDGPQRIVRQVSVSTLRRIRSLAGRDIPQPQRRVSAGQPAASGEGETEVNVAELQELNRLLRLEIEYLKLQQQSAWALGLSDDPPPGYTPPSSRV